MENKFKHPSVTATFGAIVLGYSSVLLVCYLSEQILGVYGAIPSLLYALSVGQNIRKFGNWIDEKVLK